MSDQKPQAWKPREDGPPIPEGWTVEYTPTIMDGPVIRYKPENTYRDEVSASRNGVHLYWGGSVPNDLMAVVERARWDHDRLRRRGEP